MKLPTVAALRATWPRLTPAAAEMIRSLLKGEDDPRSFASASEWFRACYHKPNPDDPELILRAVSDLVDEHGVEMVSSESADGDVATLTYINTGDTYAATLAFDGYEGEYLLTSWGAWVENEEAKGWVTK